MAAEGCWSKSFERLSADYRDLLSLGLLWLGPFQQSSDVVGLGVFLGGPSDPTLGHESGGELFWRLQLTQGVNSMPDVQYWTNDVPGRSSSGTWILGFRLNFEY